jgi:hypothetical protein
LSGHDLSERQHERTTLVLEARREKVKAITLVRQFLDDLFISDCAM